MPLLRLAWIIVIGSLSTAVFANAWIQSPEEPFESYRERLKEHLLVNKVWVDVNAKNQELEAVLPFEYRPEPTCEEGPSVGVLMFHGLSDSPFSLKDPARSLADNCVHVRVMMLPGHGTKAEDLINTTRQDWRNAVANAVSNFALEVDSIYLSGFSTGGALVAEYAWHKPDQVQGVVLFSPLFKINSSIDWLAPWLAPVIDWLDHHESDDYSKYASIPVPAISEAYKLAKEVRATVLSDPGKLPVFIALSEEDATVDASVTQNVFDKAFLPNRSSEMVLYSATRPTNEDSPIYVINTDIPEQRIFGLSHMAVHGAPNNPYYGQNGSYRICSWYQSDRDRYRECQEAEDNWYGERSDVLSSKSEIAARLSWNPFFQDLMERVVGFIRHNQKVEMTPN